MSELVLEGMWEDIAQHTEALSGKRVRVIVLEDMASPSNVFSPEDIESRRIRHGMFPQLRDLTEEERKERVKAAYGALAHIPGSVEDFLQRKHEDLDLEEEQAARSEGREG
jgi:hypothetical protein